MTWAGHEMETFMDNPSDNVFELGLLYQTVQTLKQLREKLSTHRDIQRDVDKTVNKLKTLLKSEIDKL